MLVLTRDPVADRIDRIVVAALSRTRRGLRSELEGTSRRLQCERHLLPACVARCGGVALVHNSYTTWS